LNRWIIRLHQNNGSNSFKILNGWLALKVGSDTEFLDADDSLHFDSQLPQRLHRDRQQTLCRGGRNSGVDWNV
jgi:hypothetical protein